MFGGRFLPPKGDKACAKSKSGFDCEFVYLNDLWFYDPARDEWAQGRVRGKLSPAKRDHHATAYVDGHLYVHGGKLTDQATSALKDLWRYDLVGRTWSEMHPAVAPSSRYLHNMAAWPGGHAIVLFGGETRAEINISAPMAYPAHLSLLRRRAHQVPKERQEEVCKAQRRLGLLGANQELDEPYSRRRRAADSGGGGPAGVPGERLRAARHRPGRGLPRDRCGVAGALPPQRRLRRTAGRPGVAIRRSCVRRLVASTARRWFEVQRTPV